MHKFLKCGHSMESSESSSKPATTLPEGQRKRFVDASSEKMKTNFLRELKLVLPPPHPPAKPKRMANFEVGHGALENVVPVRYARPKEQSMLCPRPSPPGLPFSSTSPRRPGLHKPLPSTERKLTPRPRPRPRRSRPHNPLQSAESEGQSTPRSRPRQPRSHKPLSSIKSEGDLLDCDNVALGLLDCPLIVLLTGNACKRLRNAHGFSSARNRRQLIDFHTKCVSNSEVYTHLSWETMEEDSKYQSLTNNEVYTQLTTATMKQELIYAQLFQAEDEDTHIYDNIDGLSHIITEQYI